MGRLAHGFVQDGSAALTQCDMYSVFSSEEWVSTLAPTLILNTP